MRLLSDFVREARPFRRARGGLVDEAAYVYTTRYAGAPEGMINVCALACAYARAGSVTLHEVRSGVARVVAETDLVDLPTEPPRLMRGPWMLEAARPERGATLFGNTVCLGGYPLDDGRMVLIGFQAPDGFMSAAWRPPWGRKLAPESIVTENAIVAPDSISGFRDWGVQAARYAVTFALLLEADGSPLDERDELGIGGAPGRGGRAPKRTERRSVDWITRHVYLTETRGTSRPGAKASETPTPDRTEVAEVHVRGHLKRQRHGPGHSLTKWIYVAAYQATRHVAVGDHKVVVHPARDSEEWTP